MDIVLNGETYRVEPHCTAAGLLIQLGLADKKLALEINGEIIPRSQYPDITIGTGDAVEIIHAVGGG